ncbi:hypothetical protein BZM27_16040 [Paraburkholderia steynii]|uniref:Uncharacterized protein n=1 Tax=Paraburkholderia steynii TaxID=1245441 RepID=A0A4R0XIQ3_9BURK|nr:hypothetical protein BZM27_16040 [Paraburkholderia steynii]
MREERRPRQVGHVNVEKRSACSARYTSGHHFAIKTSRIVATPSKRGLTIQLCFRARLRAIGDDM